MDASCRSSSRRIEFHLARKPFNGFTKDFHLETLNPSIGNPDAQKPSGSHFPLKKPEGSSFLDNGLDPELSFRITFRRIGAGLQNLGNTCFLNSVLQCLTYTEPLAAYLQSGKHQTSCRTAGFCALCAIQRHVSRALQSTGRILAPKDLVSNLRCISRNFRNSRQEDAHEYMVNLLESMHKCCLPSGVPSESPTAYERSLVHKIFGGHLRSQVKCMQCSFCSNKFDPFLDLSLEIIKADSLYKALAHFTAKEQLDGGERQYQCQQCKQKVKALKQLSIHRAPYVLTVHLKRFGSHWTGQKIDKQIQFGPTLDLKPFVTGPYDGDLKYTLYGVLVHDGSSTHSGHYYCFVRTSSGMWYSLNDNRVVQVNERKVLEQKAYMLFYVRDRKTVASKRPFDVIQKENVAVNAMGNRTHPNGVVLKESFQNGAIEKRFNVPNSSAVVPPGDASNAGASKENLTNEASRYKNNDVMMSKHTALNGNRLFEPSWKEPPLMDSLQEKLSASNLNRGECFPQSASLFRGSDTPLKLDDAIAEIPNYSENPSAKRDLCDSITMPGNRNCFQSFIFKEELTNSFAAPSTCAEASSRNDLDVSVTMPSNCSITQISPVDTCIMDKIFLGKIAEKVSPEGPSEKIPGDINLVRSKCTKTEDAEIGHSLKCASVDRIGERSSGIDLPDFSGQQIANHMSLRRKSLYSKPQHKLNNKLVRCQVTRMHLGSNMLVRASLGLWKKKKHKRGKKHMEKDLSQKHLPNTDFVLTDIGPSTSVKMDGSAQSQTKGMKSALNKKSAIIDNAEDSGGDLLMGTIQEQFRERIGQNGAELLSEEQPQNNSSIASVGNQSHVRNPNISKENRGDSRQNDLISMLTRGLETTVARWDVIDLPSSQFVESSHMDCISIGYVADEWDEEYDTGKRKKVRSSRNNFGGPNLFQEIATKKATIKKQKMDRSSGNQPFRI